VAPDLATAPVEPRRVLAIACDLALPTAVLLFSPAPVRHGGMRAVVGRGGVQLVVSCRAIASAVTAPGEPCPARVDTTRSRVGQRSDDGTTGAVMVDAWP